MLLTSCNKQQQPVDNRITVSFDWNVATTENNPEDRKINPGEKYGEMPSPNFTLDGYDFNGWNTRADARGEYVTAESVVAENADDHTLYGDWKGREYTVSYDLNGGNINGATVLQPHTVTYGKMYGAMVIPNDPEKKLSTFLGWYLNPEGTGKPVTYSTIVKTAGNHTLYAIYKDTRIDYGFESDEELEDFIDIYSTLTLNIENNKLVISNTSDDPRAYLALNTPLKAGSVVDFDVEFDGEADASDNVKAAFYLYGGNEEGRVIAAGQMGDPNRKETRDEIKQWYWGQGANNVEAWEREEWNHGHMVLHMNILEDCSCVIMMMEFGRKAIVDGEENPTGDYDPEKSLWENNNWIINSIHLHLADYDLVKPEYNFDEASDIESFVNLDNLECEIEDEMLKVSRVSNAEAAGYLEFETQYLPAGSKVEFDVQFVGEQAYSSVGEVGINTYGLYPNGMRLDTKPDRSIITDKDIDVKDDDGNVISVIPADSPHVYKWYWGGYCINNNSWDPASLVAGEFTKLVTYVYEDCFGIQMRFCFNNADGYFLINSVRVVQAGDILTKYNFASETQLLDFCSTDKSVTYTIDEDDDGSFLKVQKGSSGEGNLSLNTLLKSGQKVTAVIELSTADESFSGNPYTFLAHQAKYMGKRESETIIGKMGTNSWDGRWDGSYYEVEINVESDCYGLSLQLIFGQDANAFFKIRSIEIE